MATHQATRPSPAKQDIRGTKNPNWRGGKDVPCQRCGKPVWAKPSRQSGLKFCGRPCQYAWLAENGLGRRCPRWSGGNLKRKCRQCRAPFVAHRRDVNRGRGRFCSVGCSLAARRKQVSLMCEFCETAFSVAAHKKDTARFCSGPCKKKSQVKVRTPEEIAQRRLRLRMSTYIWYHLKHGKGKQRISWETLVGYAVVDLKRHIESLFLPGMSWRNMGEWHIDHLRPCVSFSYTSPDDPDFKACWAMSNLRPLWKVDNLIKGSKYTPT